MNLQKLSGYIRKAVDDYSMIEKNDHITAAVSGGKDSLALLCGLDALRRYYPKVFDLSAITVDLGLAGTDFSPVRRLCDRLKVPYYLVKTSIGEIIFDIRREKNPCSLCSTLRKGVLNRKAKEIGSNKIAYAHHKDDIVETLLLSLIFEGRFFCFSPKLYLDRMDLFLIRPMMYVCEEDINDFKKQYALPVVPKNCPADGFTKRQYAKELLAKLEGDHPGTKNHLFRAILNGNLPGWPEKTPDIRDKELAKAPGQSIPPISSGAS